MAILVLLTQPYYFSTKPSLSMSPNQALQWTFYVSKKLPNLAKRFVYICISPYLYSMTSKRRGGKKLNSNFLFLNRKESTLIA